MSCQHCTIRGNVLAKQLITHCSASLDSLAMVCKTKSVAKALPISRLGACLFPNTLKARSTEFRDSHLQGRQTDYFHSLCYRTTGLRSYVYSMHSTSQYCSWQVVQTRPSCREGGVISESSLSASSRGQQLQRMPQILQLCGDTGPGHSPSQHVHSTV